MPGLYGAAVEWTATARCACCDTWCWLTSLPPVWMLHPCREGAALFTDVETKLAGAGGMHVAKWQTRQRSTVPM
jgi:hypothetical protein